MSILADKITLKKLVLVKQLYQQALIQSASQHSFVGMLMSVIGFDLAIETVLKTIIGSLDPSKSPADSFQAVIQQVDNILTNKRMDLIPDKAHIQYIHTIRNDAQHKAKYPGETEVSDCRTYTRDFLQQIILDVWGLSFEGISLTDLVQNEKVKQLLINAEDALSKNDFKEATQQAVAALTWAKERVKEIIVGETESSTYWGEFVIKTHRDNFESSSKAYRAFWKMQETSLIIALGLDYTRYMRYKRITSELSFVAEFFHNRPEPCFSYDVTNNPREANINDAEFLVAYCIDTSLQIENRVESIDHPFGLKN